LSDVLATDCWWQKDERMQGKFRYSNDGALSGVRGDQREAEEADRRRET
jgi:hypothetical protein